MRDRAAPVEVAAVTAAADRREEHERDDVAEGLELQGHLSPRRALDSDRRSVEDERVCFYSSKRSTPTATGIMPRAIGTVQ